MFTDLNQQKPFFYNIPITTTGSSYYVRVSAYNDMGYGPTSEPVGPIMPQDSVPSAVYSATLKVQSDVELLVNWEAPRNDLNVHVVQAVFQSHNTWSSGTQTSTIHLPRFSML